MNASRARADEPGQQGPALRVWVDQYLCIGCSLCELVAPNVFTILEDRLSYVQDGTGVKRSPGRSEGIADVETTDEVAVREAASECPASAIFLIE